MKKIETKEDKEKKQKKVKLVMGVFIIGLMIFSTAGFAFYHTEGSQEVQEYDYSEQESPYWIARQGGETFYLSNKPEEFTEIPVSLESDHTHFTGSNLYLDIENSEIEQEIAINLGRFAPRTQQACYGECEEDLPEKDCSEIIIVHRESAQNKVYQEDNCFFIEGDMKAADAFLYEVLSLSQ